MFWPRKALLCCSLSLAWVTLLDLQDFKCFFWWIQFLPSLLEGLWDLIWKILNWEQNSTAIYDYLWLSFLCKQCEINVPLSYWLVAAIHEVLCNQTIKNFSLYVVKSQLRIFEQRKEQACVEKCLFTEEKLPCLTWSFLNCRLSISCSYFLIDWSFCRTVSWNTTSEITKSNSKSNKQISL